MFCAQSFKRVDGVAGTAAQQLTVIDVHFGQIGKSEFAHLESIGRRAERPALVPRVSGRDHAQLVQCELLKGRAGQREMGSVWRVKGPAKNAEAQTAPRTPDLACGCQTQFRRGKKSRVRAASGESCGSSRR